MNRGDPNHRLPSHKMPMQESEDNDPLLDEIVDEITRKMQGGKLVALQTYLERYPEQADSLRQIWPGLQLLAELGNSTDPTDGSSFNTSDSYFEETGNVDSAKHHLGDFRILRQAGRGGMGVVYEAEELSLGRRVALKVLPQVGLLDDRQLQRFRNEARAAAGLHHAHIVPVYSVGCDRGVHYYAMQFVEGSSLAELIGEMRRQNSSQLPGPQPTQQAVTQVSADSEQATRDTQPRAADLTDRVYGNAEWFRSVAQMGIELAEALEYAHGLGVVHRDIKPANIMLDRAGKTWITDFGLAQLESDAGLTMTGDVLGTLRYMSPEQAGGQRGRVDHRTDIYSLGLTLYELLTLRPAFVSSDRQVLLKQVLDDAPPNPRSIHPPIPYDLETVVLKAIEKNTHDRYASSQELADDLQRFLEMRPIAARRPTLIQRVTKWSRRHWAAVTTAATLLLLAAIMAAGLKLQADRRLREVAESLNVSIAATQTAIEANDLALAGLKLSEAEGILRTAQSPLPKMALAINELQRKLARREQDAERFERLIELARDAQDKMTHAADRGGEVVAEEALALLTPRDDWRTRLASATTEAQQAVDLTGVLAEENWLDSGSLTFEQQQQIRETIYELLLCLADFGVRWDEERAGESLESLSLATLFHQPTRGFYWVRAKCFDLIGDEKGADDDRQRYEQTPATFALDYYLPGHTAFWNGNANESIEAYQAALTLQPDNYNAMFFLGKRLAEQQRFEEAVIAFRGSIGLRPLNTDAHWDCAEALGSLQRFDEAEQLLVNGLERTRQKLGNKHTDTASAISNLARWQRDRGGFTQALPLYRQALEIRLESLGQTHPAYAFSLHDLAGVYGAIGQHNEAVPLLHQALEIMRESIGEDDPRFATSLHDLAACYGMLGQYVEAEPLYLQSIEIYRRAANEEHPFYAMGLNSLGSFYIMVGQYAKAEPLLQQSLEILRKTIGQENPHYTSNLENLARVYIARDQHARAESLLQEVIQIRRRTIGQQHPNFAAGLNNLAFLYSMMDEHAKAEPLLQESLKVLAESFGKKHPNYATGLNNLASFYKSTNQLAKAEPLFQEALTICRELFGEAHPNYAIGLHNLAGLHQEMGEYAKAESLYQEALGSYRESIGIENPLYTISLNKLAELYKAIDEDDKAEPLYHEAIEIGRKLRDEDPKPFLVSLSGLAELYQRKEAFDQAEPLYLEATQTWKRLFGEEHPDTLYSMASLAYHYRLQGRYAEAELMYLEALETSRHVLGKEHLSTLTAMSELGLTYFDDDRYEDAEAMLVDSIAGWQKTMGYEHRYTQRTMDHLARVYLAQRRYDEAERMLRERLAVDAKEPSEGWERAHAEALLGAALLGLDQHAEAERLLLAGYQKMEELQPRMPYAARLLLSEIAQELVSLYETTDRSELALQWRRRVPASDSTDKNEDD